MTRDPEQKSAAMAARARPDATGGVLHGLARVLRLGSPPRARDLDGSDARGAASALSAASVDRRVERVQW